MSNAAVGWLIVLGLVGVPAGLGVIGNWLRRRGIWKPADNSRLWRGGSSDGGGRGSCGGGGGCGGGCGGGGGG